MPNNVSIISGLGLVKTAKIKLTPKTTKAVFKLIRRLGEPIVKTVDKRVRIPFRKREMDLVAKRINKLNDVAEIAAKNYDDAVIAFGKVPRRHGQIQLSREGINAAKANIAAKKAARDAAMVKAHIATNENVTAVGFPKATVREKLFSALGLIHDSTKAAGKGVSGAAKKLADTDAATDVVSAGAALLTAVGLGGLIDQSQDPKTADAVVVSNKKEDDSEHSVPLYGLGGAAGSALLAYAASSRENRLRNMILASIGGGLAGSGLAYALNNRDKA